MKLFIYFFSIWIGHDIFASVTKLPILVTKVPASTIRFLSHDGKFIYYQKKSGELLFSSLYKVHIMHKGNESGMYNIVGSSSRRRLLITHYPHYYNINSIRAPGNIYVADYGNKKMVRIGEGHAAKLHLEDQWLSYYQNKNIILKPIDDLSHQVRIKLNNPINPFFIPEVTMIDDKTILYTDLNKDGLSAIILLQREKNKIIPLYKSPTPGVKIELCMKGEELIIGEFALGGVDFGARISLINLSKSKNFTKLLEIYRSKLNDIGNLICKWSGDLVYFVQNQTDKNSLAPNKTEIVSLDINTRKLNTLSDLEYAVQVINVDDRILTPFRGKFYVLEGRAKETQDQLNFKSTNLPGVDESKDENEGGHLLD